MYPPPDERWHGYWYQLDSGEDDEQWGQQAGPRRSQEVSERYPVSYQAPGREDQRGQPGPDRPRTEVVPRNQSQSYEDGPRQQPLPRQFPPRRELPPPLRQTSPQQFSPQQFPLRQTSPQQFSPQQFPLRQTSPQRVLPPPAPLRYEPRPPASPPLPPLQPASRPLPAPLPPPLPPAPLQYEPRPLLPPLRSADPAQHAPATNGAEPGRRPPGSAGLDAGAKPVARAVDRLSPAAVTLVALLTAMGLLAAQLADTRSEHGASTLDCVYLLLFGLTLIYLPAAGRILMRETSRTERIVLVLLLGLALYTVKVLTSPGGPILNDEFIHYRNTQDILLSGHLFQYNSLLPTAAYYPGLASITAVLVKLTGLSIFTCGIMVVCAGRIVVSACFYLLAEKVTGSSRGAGMASLVYMANPMFLFWSAQFAYEDLGLPLVVFTVWWITRTRSLRDRRSAQAVTVLAIAALIVTHHISAFVLCAILAAVYLAERVLRYPRAESRYLGVYALLVGALAAFWFFVVAKPAASYLIGGNLEPAVKSVINIVSGSSGHRKPFGGAAAPPKWYELMGAVAILIIMGALLPAVIRAWRLFRARGLPAVTRRRAAIVIAAVIAIAFPFTLLPRLSAVGGAVSSRSSEWVFMGIGCVVGLLMEDIARWTRIGTQQFKRLERVGGLRTVLATLMLTVVFIGEISIGTSFFALLPTSPTAPGFPVYVRPDMITAAEWARQHLGTHQGFAADANNQLSLAAYGDEDTAYDDIIYPMFFTASMNSTVVQLIKSNHIKYVLLDWRATQATALSAGGFYFSQWEPGAGENQSLPVAYFEKFATYTCSHLIYHVGSLEIYDVSGIENGTCVSKPIPPATGKAAVGKATTKKATA
jgi:hypothetical protein